MTRAFPIYIILPGSTRVSEAVRRAHDAGAQLWLTAKGQAVIAPIGRPGWRRLSITTQEAACATHH